jgi:hypothetical protein
MAAVARELIRLRLVEPGALVPFTSRPPIEPVSLGALATAPDPFADPLPSAPYMHTPGDDS